jgi:hypothetical protein
LSELPVGRIALRLKTPWSDGTIHMVYEPVDLIAKLAALIPRPRKNVVLYHGVLAAHCAWRERGVCFGRDAPSEAASGFEGGLGIGKVFSDFSEFVDEPWLPGVWGGATYKVMEKQDIRARVTLAYGKSGLLFYFAVGQNF